MPITDMLAPRHRRLRRWGFAAASLLVHAGLLAALVVSTADEEVVAAEEEVEEEVTYVDIRRFAPPPPPAATAQQAQPSQPSQPTQQTQQTPQPETPQPRPEPRTPPRATDLVDVVDSIAEADPLGADLPTERLSRGVDRTVPTGVTASRGATGGQAGGVAGGVEGGKVGGVVGGQGEEVPEEGGTFIASVVDRQAALSNRRDLPRLMQRLYPTVLRDAAIGGRVTVQFVVDTNGRVDMSTVKIVSASHDGFVEPTMQALRQFRFQPARIGDRAVRMLTQMPIVWEVVR